MSAKIKGPQGQNSDDVDILRVIGNLIDNRWLIIGITCLFILTGILYSVFSTPIYRADALVQVEQGVSGNAILNDLTQSLPTTSPESAAEIELIQSRLVLGKTVDDLHLDNVVNQSYFPIFGKGFSRLLGEAPSKIDVTRLSVPNTLLDQPLLLKVVDESNYTLEVEGYNKLDGKVGERLIKGEISILVNGIQAEKGTEFIVVKRPRLVVINELTRNLSVSDKGKDTGVLSISLDGESAELIKDIVTHISNNYLLQNVERKSEEAAKSLSFLKVQLPVIRSSLETAETKLNIFRQNNDSVDLSLEAKSVLDTMVQLESQLNELTFKEAEISKLYTKEHPAYRALLEKRTTLEEEKSKLNGKIGALPKTQQEILRLTRDVQAGQEIYMQLLNKEQELNITKASTVGNVRIVDQAETQPKPVKPQRILIILLSCIIGVMISVGFVLIKMFLFRGIESPEQLEEFGINVYASIPLSEWQQEQDRVFKFKNKKSNARSNQLLTIGNPADLAIESIRSLRTSLHFAMLEAKNNILMISGSSPSIGKTFVSTNLAAVIAKAGERVLLVDSDMRKGYAHVQLDTEGTNGLSDLLSGMISFEQAVKQTNVSNLDFIPRGQIPPNPSELLMGDRFTKFLSWASENYDLVLIDTPPVLAVTDAAIIGQQAGTSLIVARVAVNSVNEVLACIKRFDQNGINIKGVILNAMLKRAASYYTYGNYNYGYEYKSKE
ncbi:tyrosine-protein kinase Wzc [Serratia fonticola]|uniref:tyrosine-protein kinase Wzc n=1 Tax=Serratia fonticola TaxID=47917 RepID=UPI00217726A7|nr:tyrosine-protein kinase Wzc [Serratia fonticola]CAI1955100.1 Tyrosine-protein kinase wzc [Serratia fonticola]